MAGSKALPTLCFLLCAASCALAAASYDYMILSLIWPGTRCQPGWFWQPTCCVDPLIDNPEIDFLVETMETYDSATGKLVANCEPSCRFLINPLVDLLDDLNAYWPSLSCPAQNGTQKWKAAWCTYGNCTSLSEVNYFGRALQLRARADVLHALGSKAIIPSETKSYSLEDINDALVPRIGFSFTVVCIRNYIIWPLIYNDYLSQIRVCVSSDGRSIIGCPNGRESNCGDTVKFPTVSYPLHGREDDAVSKTVIELPSGDDMAL
ncbi:ribonuclease 3 [Musa acuminata AAA Group]|uniref:ribonuclease 3 n=1 Tax=Musa acuminata AAA Group TaxID=214697 RepID=UPI0031D18DE5